MQHAAQVGCARFLAAVLVLFLASATGCAGSVTPSWYSCDPTTCTNLCRCPSDSAPGKLAPAVTPQFVLLTHDDAINSLANLAVRRVTDGFKNPNGCNVPATWFVTQQGSDCKLIKALYDDNHEMAVHTVHHAALTPELPGLEQEMMGVRNWMASTCGIPKASIRGFRSPYLVHNAAVRKVLAKNTMLYDSSIEQPVGPDIPGSKTFSQRLWPYTMDNGIGQLCNWTLPDASCVTTERYKGMWEVPMWDMPNATEQTTTNAYTMDYGKGFGGDVYTTLATNFDQAYNGNRAPFPLYIHAPWVAAEGNSSATIKFIQYALSKPDVYFVTMQQLIKWMRTPVPTSEVGAMLKCNPVSLAAPKETPCREYTVKSGDFLDSIAGQFGEDVAAVVALNPGVTPNSLQPGQRLRVPPWDASCGGDSLDGGGHAAAPAASDAAVGAPAGAPLPACKTWTVGAGQYLYSVASQTSSSVAELAAANGLLTSAQLSVGQVLKLPPWAACCDADSCAPPAVAPAAAPAAAPAVPEVAVQPAPAVIDPAGAGPESDRAVLGFFFGGMGPAGFDSTARAPFVAALAQMFGVPAAAITAAVVPVRRRALRQGAVVAVDATVATDDPMAVYTTLQSELGSGRLNSILQGMGLELKGPPTVELYRDGALLALPAAVAAPAESSGSSTVPLAAIVGAAVGGAVVLVAVVAGVLVLHKRRRAVGAAAQRDGFTSSSRRAGGTASLSLRSGSLKGDKCEVVSGGSGTPTSATYRHGGLFTEP